ncbi:MAG: C39 family peptidase [Clostridia bacterium]|nr:C39 family peptidase [Clostridia bacterium]
MKKYGIRTSCVVFGMTAVAVTILCLGQTVRAPTPAAPNEDAICIAAETYIDVPVICQYPALPTGCESVSATMVLQYFGSSVTPEEFAASWLECSENFYSDQNRLHGPDPNRVFAGNPFTRQSYGCYAAPIANAVNHNSLEYSAEVLLDRSLSELCADYIDNDQPLLIWATMGMKESYAGTSWYLEDGSEFTWIAEEHCLVLVGYNDAYYLLNDPLSGSTVAYQKALVEKRYAELGKQAVVIYPNTPL